MDAAIVAVVMPVFNDWPACRSLLRRLDQALASRNRAAVVILVDDGSTARDEPAMPGDSYMSIEPRVLRLRRNLGHQRAICIALAYVHDTMSPDVTVVMDSDGEDAAEDVPRLLDEVDASGGQSVVFARRTKRQESYLFRVGYALFRVLHRVATGHDIAFGNFSAIPRARLASLVTVGDLWNNFAASVLVSKQPYRSIPTTRATRLAGRPQMNLVSLVIHGLSAIAVFGEVVSVRCALVGVVGAALVGAALLLSASGVLPLSTPVLVFLAVLAQASLQLTAFAILFGFITLSRRSAAVFHPATDYQLFLSPRERPHPARGPVGGRHPR
jgi:hypothetical protein